MTTTIMTTTTTTVNTTMTSRAKQRFGPERVRNAVFAFTAGAFALAFAAVSGGNDASTEAVIDLPLASHSQVVAPVEAVVLTNSSAPIAVTSQSIGSTSSSGTVKVIQLEPKPPAARRQVVVPFPRARSRAS